MVLCARLSILTIVLICSVSLTANQNDRFNPPKQYYLALGDSVAYGYQRSKAQAGLPPSGFDTGYVDFFGARLREIRPDLITVNYGCPGETTTSFIRGPCLWTALGGELHDPFSGSQLDAAVAFLLDHRGQVSPITVTLWGNDIGRLAASCRGDLECVRNGAPNLIAQVSRNLAITLSRLRAVAPDAQIIVTGSWDIFFDALSFADPLFQALNGSMSTVATAARVRFADPFPVFNPQGDLSMERQTMCTLTLQCTEGDVHPSDSGYQVLADLVFDASDYMRLLR